MYTMYTNGPAARASPRRSRDSTSAGAARAKRCRASSWEPLASPAEESVDKSEEYKKDQRNIIDISGIKEY